MDEKDLSATYSRLVEIGIALSIANNLDSLLKQILREATSVANADAGLLYLQVGGNTQRCVVTLSKGAEASNNEVSEDSVSLPDVQLTRGDGSPDLSNIISLSLIHI